MSTILIADSGATKCNWILTGNGTTRKVSTVGINPYFLSVEEITQIIKQSRLSAKKGIEQIRFYGAGLANLQNKKKVKKALSNCFPGAELLIDTDLAAAALATCGKDKGMISILGTGSGCAFFNGNKITKVQNGLGYVLGDEGSGAYLGRKVLQYYLYNTFDEDLNNAFQKKYVTDRSEILNHIYHQPTPNRYLASFSGFLSENRGHYMVENILEDGLNDFITTHIYKFREAWKYPLHFTGGVAFAFRDILKQLCDNYELELGVVIKNPIDKLVQTL